VLLRRAVEAPALPGVDPTDRQVRVVDDAEEYLARVAAELRGRGLTDVQTSAWYGPAVSAITDAAAVRGVDLIVMSTHGRGGLGRAVIGSVAESVLRTAKMPVLLVRASAAGEPTGAAAAPGAGYRRALVPLDGSPFAESVLPLVADLAGSRGMDVVLLRVVEPAPMPVFDEAQKTLAHELVTRREDAEAYLAPIAGDLRDRGVRVESRVGRGDAAREITRMTRETGADLIVMCTHGRTGVRRMVFGSVAGAVVHASAVPVLLLKPAAAGRPSARSTPP
jgi:nucleotide-binding universal stress UspA family protein